MGTPACRRDEHGGRSSVEFEAVDEAERDDVHPEFRVDDLAKQFAQLIGFGPGFEQPHDRQRPTIRAG